MALKTLQKKKEKKNQLAKADPWLSIWLPESIVGGPLLPAALFARASLPYISLYLVELSPMDTPMRLYIDSYGIWHVVMWEGGPTVDNGKCHVVSPIEWRWHMTTSSPPLWQHVARTTPSPINRHIAYLGNSIEQKKLGFKNSNQEWHIAMQLLSINIPK